MTPESFQENVIEILNKVYIHGSRKSVAISRLPPDEMTIADGKQAILELLKESLGPEKEIKALGYIISPTVSSIERTIGAEDFKDELLRRWGINERA